MEFNNVTVLIVDKEDLKNTVIPIRQVRAVTELYKSLLERDSEHETVIYEVDSCFDGKDLIRKSNFDVFWNHHSHLPEVKLLRYYDGEAIILTREAYNEPQIQETLASLENYPVLDDSDYSLKEYEAFLESWDDWGYRDFLRGLYSKFKLASYPSCSQVLDDSDSDTLREFYKYLQPNCLYEVEGSEVILYIAEAVRNCTKQNLVKFIKENR